MGQLSFRLLFSAVLLLLVVLANAGPPKPMKVRCKEKKFSNCYRKDLFCPITCPRSCEVDCISCQPVCIIPAPPLPPRKHKPKKVKCQNKKFPSCYHKDLFCPVTCPRTCVADCASCQPLCDVSQVPLPPITPPTLPPLSPPLPPSTPPQPPPLSPPLPPSTPPQPPPLSPPLPPSTPNTPPPETASGKRVYCSNKLYPQCYHQELRCPSACPDTCEVDCVTCSPVCNCNRPGAVCQDPRFVGADGLTFYFHGEKDHDFCLVTDPNLHINARFIGRRNENMKRDFTWVQSLGILFNNHQIFVGAKRTATWNNAVDRLDLAFNEEPIFLPNHEGAKWESISAKGVSISRTSDTNSIVIQVDGNFKIKATVVPITEKESRTHNYGITEENCFAHLDLGFKFYSLSDEVNGVLGQTYANNYVSNVKMGIEMPVLGGKKNFSSSSLFSTDCAVSRFSATDLWMERDLFAN